MLHDAEQLIKFAQRIVEYLETIACEEYDIPKKDAIAWLLTDNDYSTELAHLITTLYRMYIAR